MATDDLTTYREAACEAARRGAAVLEGWRSRFQVREKGRASISSPTPTSPHSGPSTRTCTNASPLTPSSARKKARRRRGRRPTRRRRGSAIRWTAPPITSTTARSTASR